MESPEDSMIPAIVIVDTRNMWGQTSDVFGVGRRVEVQGVMRAMRSYGFDVQHVYAGIATTCSQSRPSELLQRMLEMNLEYAQAIEAHDLGTVLHGRLAERDGKLEEKLVDVLCAIQIAEEVAGSRKGDSSERVIIVLSEDMDLIPAYEFARRYGVRTFAASNATVDTRSGNDWLLLPESPMGLIAGAIPGRYKGTQLRNYMARQVISGNSLKMNFEVVGSDDNCVYLRHNSGLNALWNSPPRGRYARRSKHELFVTGVIPEVRGSEFPRYLVGKQDTGSMASGTVEAEVLAWRSPCRLEVKLPNSEKKVINAPLGCALPGMRVLLASVAHNPANSYKLIGATTGEPSLPGWPNIRQPELVRVASDASRPGELVRSVVIASGTEVTLQPPGAETPHVGDVYAVLPARVAPTPEGTSHVSTIAVSTRLR